MPRSSIWDNQTAILQWLKSLGHEVEETMTRQEIQDATAKLCGVLTELGFEYHTEADNRSQRRSHYIYVRRPKYMEIRISDHPPGKVHRRKQFDIGPHGITVEKAIEEITALAAL